MKNKNIVLLKIIAYLILSVILLSKISLVRAMSETSPTTVIDYFGSKNLITGEEKTEAIERKSYKGRSKMERFSKGYIPDKLKNQIDVPPLGPQNPNQTKPTSIIDNDNRYQIKNEWRNLWSMCRATC